VNQKTQILEWLKAHGSLTPQESWHELGIYRLAPRVFELRHKDGYDIEKVMEPMIAPGGKIKHYARYYLRGEPEQKGDQHGEEEENQPAEA